MMQDNVHNTNIRTYAQKLTAFVVIAFLTLFNTAGADDTPIDKTQGKPLKVFILAGQSNMQGKGRLHTIERLAETPDSADMYKEMTGGDGKYQVTEPDLEAGKQMQQYKGKKYTVVPDTYISFLGARGWRGLEVNGPLTVGFGDREDQIGPEYTFGIYMQKQLNEPILIIKTAWGGKSLCKQFLSPSGRQLSGESEPGEYYTKMIDHVKKVLADPGKYHPAYDKDAGYEIAGFVWFQGWNDLVNGFYDTGEKEKDYTPYSELLAHFIRDLRKELKAPEMPFVIGVLGVGGQLDPGDRQQAFREAMAAPASMEEFKETVTAVRTGEFWDMEAQKLLDKVDKEVWKRIDSIEEIKNKPVAKRNLAEKMRKTVTAEALTAKEFKFLETGTSNASFHYLGSAYTYGKIGKAFADTMAKLLGVKTAK